MVLRIMEFEQKDGAATNHVVEYYKKFSQNRELPKYFSGTSMSYLPVIKDTTSPEPDINNTIKSDVDIVITTEEINAVPENVCEGGGISRASSPMSSHKLEWDSGADIGYTNCPEKLLRKSSSLPIMLDAIQKESSTDFETVKSGVAVTRSQSSSSDSNIKVVLLPYSSGSEYCSDNENVCANLEGKRKDSSSSFSNNLKSDIVHSISSSDSNKQSLKQFASTLSYLKQKIGLPGAQSTPKFEDVQQKLNNMSLHMPVHRKSSSSDEKDDVKSVKTVDTIQQVQSSDELKEFRVKPNANLQMEKVTCKESEEKKSYNKKNIKCQNQRIVNLAVTKPVTVECTCSNQSVTIKSSQTARKQLTVAVQTDEITERELVQIIHNSQRNYNNQSLIYFEYSESDRTGACSTQTNSDFIESNCDSFEYLKKTPPLLEEHQVSSKNEIDSRQCTESNRPEQATNLKRTQKTNDLRDDISENSSSSKDACLGNLVSASLAENGEHDIGKSIYLLQRLLKSKKYDPVTKKRYIKKIIKKITELKYLEESSTSSELFVPKKATKSDPLGETGGKNLLQSNIPWYPIASEPLKVSPKKALVQKTFTQDFLPQRRSSREDIGSAPEIVPINARDTRKNRFTLTNNEFSVNYKGGRGIEKNHSGKILTDTDSASLEKHYESSSTSKSYQNWKDDKTLSERILEKQSEEKSHSSNGTGDYFLKFDDKEREFKIDWINNEICQLGRLKGLLQKPHKHKKPSDIKKSTNFYAIAKENGSKSKVKHNYVIETLIGAPPSSKMTFNLDGQVYTVHEYSDAKRKRESRPVTGNIEVVAGDTTTNIKVTTFCRECKRLPCICNADDDEEGCSCLLQNPGGCGSDSCICHAEFLAKLASTAAAEKTPAGNYMKVNCLCAKSSSTAHFDSCTSCSCKNHLAYYNTKYKESARSVNNDPKDDVSGIFLPIDPFRSTKVKFPTFPCTSKEGHEKSRDVTSSHGVDSADRAPSAYCSNGPCRDQANGYGSLRKVFINCACTQTNHTCGFVEKLTSHFSKADVPYGSKSQQTQNYRDVVESEAIGLQSSADTENRHQQTATSNIDDKYVQTEKRVNEAENQTAVHTYSQNQQTGSTNSVNAQTQVSRIDENFQNIGIQAKANSKDEMLQTSPTDQHKSNIDGGSQTKTVNFAEGSVVELVGSVECLHKEMGRAKRQQKISAQKSIREDAMETASRRLPLFAENSSLNNIVMVDDSDNYIQKEAATSPAEESLFVIKHEDPHSRHSFRTSVDTMAKHQMDANTSPSSTGVGSLSDSLKKQYALTSSRKDSKEVSGTKQDASTAQSVHSMGTLTSRPKLTIHHSLDRLNHRDESTTVPKINSVSTSADLKEQEPAASQTEPMYSRSSTSRPSSSKSSSSRSDRQKKVICVCCCTQTRGKLCDEIRKKSAKCQVKMDSDKDKEKHRGYSLTTSSAIYEICPSILVSSYNDTSQSTTEGSSSKSSVIICFCCNEKYPSDKISILGSKDESYPLCCNCLSQRPILTALCYAGPEENCPCSKPPCHKARNADVSEETKRTTTDSNDLEEYCSCTKPFQFKNSRYCSHCQFKLRNTARNKNGIAYTLTLESDHQQKVKKKKKRPSLEEIKVKVPSPSSKKKHKDKENVTKRDSEKEKGCHCGKIICTRNCHVHGVSSKHRKNGLSLQEYLKKNRPDFIESAESRRNVVQNSKSERECGLQDAKFQFVEKFAGQDMEKRPKKLFTEKEMREITRRNYKKLPEVRNKINNEKEQKVRNADRFIVDIFARKIQRCVLKGKRNFPIDSNVICLPKTCNC